MSSINPPKRQSRERKPFGLWAVHQSSCFVCHCSLCCGRAVGVKPAGLVEKFHFFWYEDTKSATESTIYSFQGIIMRRFSFSMCSLFLVACTTEPDTSSLKIQQSRNSLIRVEKTAVM